MNETTRRLVGWVLPVFATAALSKKSVAEAVAPVANVRRQSPVLGARKRPDQREARALLTERKAKSCANSSVCSTMSGSPNAGKSSRHGGSLQVQPRLGRVQSSAVTGSDAEGLGRVGDGLAVSFEILKVRLFNP